MPVPVVKNNVLILRKASLPQSGLSDAIKRNVDFLVEDDGELLAFHCELDKAEEVLELIRNVIDSTSNLKELSLIKPSDYLEYIYVKDSDIVLHKSFSNINVSKYFAYSTTTNKANRFLLKNIEFKGTFKKLFC